MHRLSTLLGMPQHRFASIHVVGTNGKSSVTRMTAALLQANGLRTGACVSPHAARWSERVLVDGVEISPQAFASAVERAALAADTVNRALEERDVVTQFELATAASFVALAAARVDVAVIEAGLGGRLDATNTIPSRVTILTSIGLDHTQWLGDSRAEIAAEKLAVLRDHTVLVVGRLDNEIQALAADVAERRGARLVAAPEDPGDDVRLAVAGAFQRRNFALAVAAAEAFLDEPLDRESVMEVAASLHLPGRLEPVVERPPTYLDAAHNADGATALADAAAELAHGRPVVLCMAVLADKDAGGIAQALAGTISRVICTELAAGARPSLAAAELAEVFEGEGVPATPEVDAERAVRRASKIAAEEGGITVVAGSHYLLSPARRALGLCDD
jgi:dihydrofolate synthase/folylpolyglutamate synthase